MLDEFCDAAWLEDGLARPTLDAYRRDLRMLAEWLERERGAGLATATEQDLLAYLGQRAGRVLKGIQQHVHGARQHSSRAIVASRSHRNAETDDFIARFPGADVVAAGSSQKLCALADGRADLYPRLGDTSQWDIDRKSTRLNSSHVKRSRMPSSA